ncbi:MAG: class I SAM-dependent methyltransferase [Betaproteobacteria bacterium]|nr:MAG: class I SAM-dependent methyltransferase [Betaproteobacteria bacterium]
MSDDVPVASASGDEAPFTGERFLPQCSGEIAYEHWHRYAFARSLASGKTVLDVASGEGYGAALLSAVAARVHGVDIDAATVERASRKYAGLANLSFVRASCTALPFADHSFDRIVSFETIEHIDANAQIRMLEEFDRLLAPDGMVVLSSPNKAEYTDVRGTRNEFHIHELYRDELANLLARHFAAIRWFGQRAQWWSGIWSETAASAPIEALSIDDLSVRPYDSPQAMYYVVLAARSEAVLAAPHPRGSILTNRDDSVTKRYETAVGQLIQHYKLVDELTAACDRQAGHVLHLEHLVSEHDAAIERQQVHIRHLEQLVVERERERETAVTEQRAALAQADALRLETERLRSAHLEAQKTIGGLQERVRRLSDAVGRMYTWRWWIRFPFDRARGAPPPQ